MGGVNELMGRDGKGKRMKGEGMKGGGRLDGRWPEGSVFNTFPRNISVVCKFIQLPTFLQIRFDVCNYS